MDASNFSLSFSQIFWSLAGGILPVILWLWLWLKEDTHKEPRKRVAIAFIGGMVAVPLVVPFQEFVRYYAGLHGMVETSTVVIILWAAIEEIFKLGAAFLTSLTKKENNAPIEPLIYLITTALGFAALENVLYLMNPIHSGDILTSVNTGNLRFIGANLIHIISSSAIGVSLGLAFYKSKTSKFLHLLAGLFMAITLHSLFNLFIINVDGIGALGVFFVVWVCIVILALFFEKIKTINYLATSIPDTPGQ